MPDHSSAAREHALMQEITAPLDTLPDDPLALVEAEFPLAMRGYDRHAVDDYVEQVSRLVAELHATRSPESAVRRALERVGEEVSGVLQRAHETAEEITAQSRRDAEDRLERARREAASLVEAAERRVRELDADADRVWADRARIIADTEALSGQLLAVARDANARFPVEETRPLPLLDHLSDAESQPAAEAPYDDRGGAEEPAADEEPAPRGDGPDAEAEPDTLEGPAGGGQAGLEDPEDPEVPEDPTEPIDPTQRMSISHDDSTRVIPPASDAAQRRHEP